MAEFWAQYGQVIIGLAAGLITATGVSALVIAYLVKILRGFAGAANTLADKLEEGERAGASAKQVKGSIKLREAVLREVQPVVAEVISNVAQRVDRKKPDPKPKKKILGVIGKILWGLVLRR